VNSRRDAQRIAAVNHNRNVDICEWFTATHSAVRLLMRSASPKAETKIARRRNPVYGTKLAVRIETKRTRMNCLQRTFPTTGLHSWHDRRCLTLPTISQRRSPRLHGEPNRAGWSWREAIEPSARTWNVGMPSERTATQSKSQAPATQSMCHIPRKSHM